MFAESQRPNTIDTRDDSEKRYFVLLRSYCGDLPKLVCMQIEPPQYDQISLREFVMSFNFNSFLAI